MSKRRTLVVTRQLGNFQTAVSAILELPKEIKDDLAATLKAMAMSHIRIYENLMPEFNQATWTLDYVETSDDPSVLAVYWESSSVIKPQSSNVHTLVPAKRADHRAAHCCLNR